MKPKSYSYDNLRSLVESTVKMSREAIGETESANGQMHETMQSISATKELEPTENSTVDTSNKDLTTESDHYKDLLEHKISQHSLYSTTSDGLSCDGVSYSSRQSQGNK